jgi:hypothetical protein
MTTSLKVITAALFFLIIGYLQGCAPLEVGVDAEEQKRGRLVFKSM